MFWEVFSVTRVVLRRVLILDTRFVELFWLTRLVLGGILLLATSFGACFGRYFGACFKK